VAHRLLVDLRSPGGRAGDSRIGPGHRVAWIELGIEHGEHARSDIRRQRVRVQPVVQRQRVGRVQSVIGDTCEACQPVWWQLVRSVQPVVREQRIRQVESVIGDTCERVQPVWWQPVRRVQPVVREQRLRGVESVVGDACESGQPVWWQPVRVADPSDAVVVIAVVVIAVVVIAVAVAVAAVAAVVVIVVVAARPRGSAIRIAVDAGDRIGVAPGELDRIR